MAVVQTLLAAGFTPNAKGAQGATPLVLACDTHKLDIITLLLEAHAEPNLPAYGGVTPLFTPGRDPVDIKINGALDDQLKPL